jgi:hypothetical protein
LWQREKVQKVLRGLKPIEKSISAQSQNDN